MFLEEKSHLDELQEQFKELKKEYEEILLKQKIKEQEKMLLDMQKAKMNQAATMLQKLWRGYKTRKDLKKQKSDGKKKKR